MKRYKYFESAGFSFLTIVDGIDETTYIIDEKTGQSIPVPTDVLNAFIAQRYAKEERCT